MRRIALCAVAACLAGCGSLDIMEGPIVDMRGVDSIKYNNDLAACRQKRAEAGSFALGPVISNCMEERGYTIVSKRSYSLITAAFALISAYFYAAIIFLPTIGNVLALIENPVWSILAMLLLFPFGSGWLVGWPIGVIARRSLDLKKRNNLRKLDYPE